MTTRNKRSLTEITGDVESAQQYPSLGEPPSLAATASVDQLSHDDLKSAVLELGYELHQKRKQKSAVTQKEEVEGKKRVTIYVPTAMRTAIGHASVATEKNISTIVSEALELWMAKHGLRY